jgi:hypothetical protein
MFQASEFSGTWAIIAMQDVSLDTNVRRGATRSVERYSAVIPKDNCALVAADCKVLVWHFRGRQNSLQLSMMMSQFGELCRA